MPRKSNPSKKKPQKKTDRFFSRNEKMAGQVKERDAGKAQHSLGQGKKPAKQFLGKGVRTSQPDDLISRAKRALKKKKSGPRI